MPPRTGSSAAARARSACRRGGARLGGSTPGRTGPPPGPSRRPGRAPHGGGRSCRQRGRCARAMVAGALDARKPRPTAWLASQLHGEPDPVKPTRDEHAMTQHAFQTEVQQMPPPADDPFAVFRARDLPARARLPTPPTPATSFQRFQALTKPELTLGDETLKVEVSGDAAARTLVLTDNGIGMSEAEAIDHLGTIAKSGTKAFLQNLGQDQAKNAHLIGQFGVGFYSAFMVAERVVGRVGARRAPAATTACAGSRPGTAPTPPRRSPAPAAAPPSPSTSRRTPQSSPSRGSCASSSRSTATTSPTRCAWPRSSARRTPRRASPPSSSRSIPARRCGPGPRTRSARSSTASSTSRPATSGMARPRGCTSPSKAPCPSPRCCSCPARSRWTCSTANLPRALALTCGACS